MDGLDGTDGRVEWKCVMYRTFSNGSIVYYAFRARSKYFFIVRVFSFAKRHAIMDIL